jgi:hypothetical protein
MRRHIFDLTSDETAATKATAAAKTPEDELRAALGSLYPHRQLPTFLSAGYVKTPDNSVLLNVAMQLDGASLSFEQTDGRPELKKNTEVDVLGIALDDRGSFSSFRQKLSVTREAVAAADEHAIQWNQSLRLPPGLYQVRVAIRERDTGRIGSAMQWLEIPRLDAASIAMSNIFIGERKASPNASQRVAVNVDRKFARSSSLRYQAYLYRPARTLDTSEVALEVKVIRESRAVITVPAGKLGTASTADPTSFPVAGEISLNQFPPGQYTLQISATDKTDQTTVSQQIQFAIE